jgi:hypothetical protein
MTREIRPVTEQDLEAVSKWVADNNLDAQYIAMMALNLILSGNPPRNIKGLVAWLYREHDLHGALCGVTRKSIDDINSMIPTNGTQPTAAV